MKTVAGVFPTMIQAQHVMKELEETGIPSDSLSLIAGNQADRHQKYLEKSHKAAETTASAAASGASFGGGMGILASLAALAIPGVGPIIAGGAIATVLTGLGIGAASGGVIAAFKNMGISHEEAPFYEEAVRRGSIILIAKVDDGTDRKVADIMERGGAQDLRREADTWRAAGWSGPKTDPHPYVSDDTARSHEMTGTVDTEPSDR